MRKETDSWQANIADVVNGQYRVFLRLGFLPCRATWLRAVGWVQTFLNNPPSRVCSVVYCDGSKEVVFYGSGDGYKFSLVVPVPKFEVK